MIIGYLDPWGRPKTLNPKTVFFEGLGTRTRHVQTARPHTQPTHTHTRARAQKRMCVYIYIYIYIYIRTLHMYKSELIKYYHVSVNIKL